MKTFDIVEVVLLSMFLSLKFSGLSCNVGRWLSIVGNYDCVLVAFPLMKNICSNLFCNTLRPLIPQRLALENGLLFSRMIIR